MTRYIAAVALQDTLFKNQPHTNAAAQKSPTAFISAILPNIYFFSGLILLIYLVFGGFTYISASGNADQAQKGQKAMTNAIIGFIIIFTSYWIVQIIQVLTGVPILKGYTF